MGQKRVMHDVPFEDTRLFHLFEVEVDLMPVVPFHERRHGHHGPAIDGLDLVAGGPHRIARRKAVIHQQDGACFVRLDQLVVLVGPRVAFLQVVVAKK